MRVVLKDRSRPLDYVLKHLNDKITWIVCTQVTEMFGVRDSEYLIGDITYILKSSNTPSSSYYHPEDNHLRINYVKSKFRELTKRELESFVYEPYVRTLSIPSQEMPTPIVRRIIVNQLSQNRPIKDFMLSSHSYTSTFTFSLTKEGHEFWVKVVHDRNFSHYYTRYPEDRPVTTDKDDLSKTLGDLDRLADTLTKKPESKKKFSDKVPEVIKQAIGYKQIEAGNLVNIFVYDSYRRAGKHEGGFTWDISKEGMTFWEDIIVREKFDVFFSKYATYGDFMKAQREIPRKEEVVSSRKPTDYFPFIIQRALKYLQSTVGNTPDLSVFDECISASKDMGGFNWSDTEEGMTFWENVLMKKDFRDFHDIYSSFHHFKSARDRYLENKEKKRKEEIIKEHFTPKDEKVSKVEPESNTSGMSVRLKNALMFLQQRAGNEPDISIFDRSLSTSALHGGFDWGDTLEGDSFWDKVLYRKDYILFDGTYPNHESFLKRYHEEDPKTIEQYKRQNPKLSLSVEEEVQEVRKVSPMVNIKRPLVEREEILPVARGNIKRR